MSRQDVAADRVLSLTLKFGAYTAFALILAGLLQQFMAVGRQGGCRRPACPAGHTGAEDCGGVHSVFARAGFQVCSGVVWRAGDCGAGLCAGITGLNFTAKDAKAAKELVRKKNQDGKS